MAVTKLPNGFTTAVLDGTTPFEFAIISSTLPGFEGGDLPDTTTNSNTTYRSVGARDFIQITPFSATVAYDPDAYSTAQSCVNDLRNLTVTVKDGRTVSFGVVMKTFTPGEATEDGFPTADVEFTVDTGVDGDTGITVTPAP